MKIEDLKSLVKEIVKQATELKNKHIEHKNAPVNYACIFSQSQKEYDDFLDVIKKIGKVVKETSTGLIFEIGSLNTVSGVLKLLKIRLPESTRSELGYADFTIGDYSGLKKKYISEKGFALIKREKYEMIELIDPGFNVRVYFSYPPFDKIVNEI